MTDHAWQPGDPEAYPSGTQAAPGPPSMPDAGDQGYRRDPAPTGLAARIKKALAPLAGAGALLAKFGALLVKLKAFTVVGSMAVSLLAYTSIWGWRFALGFVLLIFVHEMGHVVVLRARGIKAGAPIFLPFLGAFVSMKSPPRSAYEEAESAIAGPIAGTLAAITVGYIAHATGSDLLRSLAFSGFFLNLFNLLPALPLDGGRVAGALHPGIWLLGLLALLGWEIVHPNAIVLILLLFGGYELYQRWRNRGSQASQVYFALQQGQRLRIATAYLVLVGVIVAGMHATYIPRTL